MQKKTNFLTCLVLNFHMRPNTPFLVGFYFFSMTTLKMTGLFSVVLRTVFEGLLSLFWWLSSFSNAVAWTKQVISSEFSLQGDYQMCQHAIHSHIIKCFGSFTAIYSNNNAFCAPPTFPHKNHTCLDNSTGICLLGSLCSKLQKIKINKDHHLF